MPVAVKSTIPTATKYWKNAMYAMIVRTKGQCPKSDGSVTTSSQNAAVIVGRDSNPLGTRVLGDISDKHAKNAAMVPRLKYLFGQLRPRINSLSHPKPSTGWW